LFVSSTSFAFASSNSACNLAIASFTAFNFATAVANKA
jgi:hypothetical protein